MSDGTNPQNPQQPSESTAPPSPLQQFMAMLEGRKTFVICAAAVIYLVGSDVGWWPYNAEVLGILGFGGLAALRNGIKAKETTR